MIVRNAIVAVALLSLIGCSTVQTIQTVQPEAIGTQVEPGDRAIIVARSGVTYDLRVQEVAADSLTGKAESGKRYRVMYSAIGSIRVERPNPAATAAGGVAVVGVVLAVLLIVAIGEGMEDLGEAFACIFGGCDDDE